MVDHLSIRVPCLSRNNDRRYLSFPKSSHTGMTKWPSWSDNASLHHHLLQPRHDCSAVSRVLAPACSDRVCRDIKPGLTSRESRSCRSSCDFLKCRIFQQTASPGGEGVKQCRMMAACTPLIYFILILRYRRRLRIQVRRLQWKRTRDLTCLLLYRNVQYSLGSMC